MHRLYILTCSHLADRAYAVPARAMAPVNPSAPTLTKEGYFTVPPFKRLRRLPDDNLRAVDRFVVGREDVGEVMFLKPVDVRGLDLDAVLEIEKGKIVLYPERSAAAGAAEAVPKPPPGQGLNVPAMLSFHRMVVKQRDNVKAVAKFRQKLVDHAAKIGAVFVHYDADTGTWIMKVDEF